MISPDGALHIRHSPVFEPLIAADNPHANRLTVHILAAVAEHERAAISERASVRVRLHIRHYKPTGIRALEGVILLNRWRGG